MANVAAAPKKSFHVELWGDIQIIYDRYEEGRKTLSELIRFFTDRVDADTSYAKDVSKLVTKAYSVTERGSVGDLWNATKRAHEGLSKQCAELGSQIKRDVVAPLEVVKKNQGLQKEMLEKKVDKLVKDLAKSKDNWQKAKQKYYSCKKAAELALATYERAQADPSMQTTKLSKLNTAQQQAKKEAEVAEAAYRMSIKDFNLTQAKYEEDMIKNLMEFQDMEMKRIEAVQEAMQKFNMVLVASATGLEQNRLLLYKSTESVNAAADIQLFIEDRKTGQSYPTPVEFEAYVDTAPAVPAKPGSSSPPMTASSSRPKSEMLGLKKDEINQVGRVTVKATSLEEVKKSDDEKKRKEEEERKKKEEEDKRKKDEEERKKKEDEEKRKKEEEAKKREEEEKKKKQAAEVVPGSPKDIRESRKEKKTKKEHRKEEPKREEPKREEPKKAATTTPAAAAAPAPAAEPTKKAKAIFDYKAGDNTELSFKMGDIILVTHQDESGWWDGMLNGQSGMFPGNHVELMKDEPAEKKEEPKKAAATTPGTPAAPSALAAAASPANGAFVCAPGEKKVKVLFNFAGTGEDELKITEGDIVIVEEEVKGWYVGRNAKGLSGMFPANYAEDLK